MDPKTRIQTALNHQQPDRVPLTLWGGPYGLVDPLYFDLVKLLDLGEPSPTYPRRTYSQPHG